MSKLYNIIKSVKAFSKTGGSSVPEWQLKAAKAKKDAAKFNLEQTLKETDKKLKKLKDTEQKTKHYYAPKDF